MQTTTIHKCLLFALMIRYCWGDDECTRKTSQLPHRRLKKDLLCNYDTSQRPVLNPSTPVNITLSFLLKFFTYDMHSNTISLNGRLIMSWQDQHLKWDSKNYDNISDIRLQWYEIWTPDLSLYNRNEESGNAEILRGMSNCWVFSIGYILCVAPVKLESLCKPNLEKYPFDRQTCMMTIGSWIYPGEEINLFVGNKALNLFKYTPNEEWNLTSVLQNKNLGMYGCCPNTTYPSVSYVLEMERHSATIATVIVIPGLILLIMTLMTVWMDPSSSDRLLVALVNVISHFTYLESMSWRLPSSGDSAPLIISFYRDSLLLCAFSILLTIILRSVVRTEQSSPNWMSLMVGIIVSKRPGQIFLLTDGNLREVIETKEDDENDVAKPKIVDKDWILFAKLLDRLTFIIFFIIYMRMFIFFLL